ncbi:unnamed protein product [Linum tenue]|uniref:Uncharacterized protein n=1 Tax=Linum tenue TaxID=586396 RepID=A0AAV0KDC6_9ROSI|nr:unnamed protein product [Linum tenue]
MCRCRRRPRKRRRHIRQPRAREPLQSLASVAAILIASSAAAEGTDAFSFVSPISPLVRCGSSMAFDCDCSLLCIDQIARPLLPFLGSHIHSTLGQWSIMEDFDASGFPEHPIRGALMIAIGCVCWAGFVNLQAITLESYPGKLSLTALICMMGAMEGSVVAVGLEWKNPSAWTIGFDTELLAAFYSGIISSGVVYSIQGLVMQRMLTDREEEETGSCSLDRRLDLKSIIPLIISSNISAYGGDSNRKGMEFESCDLLVAMHESGVVVDVSICGDVARQL